MKPKRRSIIPLNVVLPVVSAALVIGLAMGLGLTFLAINAKIGEPEALATALGVTILIMAVAIFLTTRAADV